MFTLMDTVSRFRFAGVAAVLCALQAVAAGQTITLKLITPIAVPQGVTYFFPDAINASGDVVGDASFSGGASTVLVYSHGIATDIGPRIEAAFNCSNSTCSIHGSGINNGGQVVGWLGLFDPIQGVCQRAFLYDRGVVHDLGTLGGQFIWASSINNSGEVAGSSDLGANVRHAFLYSGGVMRDLGTLGGLTSFAKGINDAGDVVGQSDVTATVPHAFLYSKGVMHDLDAPPGAAYGFAEAINASGQTVGEVALPCTGYVVCNHAFLYANGVTTDIVPSLPVSYAHGINASGQIVGEEYDFSLPSYRAFLYQPATGVLDLNSLLPPNSGWVLTIAYAINDAGQIAGSGMYMGQPSAFLLTIGAGSGPATTASISGPAGANGWYVGTVSVTLSATDQSSSVSATYFSVDGATYQLYGGPFPIAGDGIHQLSYYSIDTGGSQEKTVQQTIRIDATKPVSHVAALPATAPAPSFNVTWSGTDATSGIASYTIFVRDNGGAFAPWISGTTGTQATYAGVAGHTYGFYSIATDVAGNQEPAKTSAEATTTVPTRPVSHVAPLPANAPAASFTVQWSGSAPGVGIRDYTIYASDNGGAFAPWLSATANTQGTYPGVCEHNYGFYSIATDNRGIQEVAKTTAEATTRVPFNPVSHVLALPAIASSPNFNVQWAAVNTCTPIGTWDIYVSDNGGAFAMWKARTSATQAYFSGVLGHAYGFYSIAFDSGGGAEVPKSSADAITQTPAVMAADVNSDGRIDCNDVSVVKAAMGTRSGQPGFNARADLNGDGVVDVRDLAIVTQKLAPGATCP